MAKVSIDKLKPGMRLLRPVTNKNGMVVLNKDMELTEGIINRLADIDVRGVHIQGMSEPAASREEMLADLDARFRHVEEEPYMPVLKRLVREHIEDLYGQA
jgi:hypothetical protein